MTSLLGRLFAKDRAPRPVPSPTPTETLASGLAHHKAGRLDDALVCYRDALAVDATNFDALHLAGLAHQQANDTEAAIHYLSAAVRRDPQHRDALAHLAGVHELREEWPEAAQALRKLAELDASSPDAWTGLARCYLRMGRSQEGEAACAKAIALAPRHHDANVQLGIARKHRGDLAAAEAAFRTALADRPTSPVAQYNLAMLVLARGDYHEGFRLFESRHEGFAGTAWDSPRIREFLRDARRWHGEPLAGRRILVWGEQGFGDVIMVLRYLPMIKAAGASALTVQCEPPLLRLVAAVIGVDAVISDQTSIDPRTYDLHCPIMSLPHVFSTAHDAIPPLPSFALADEPVRQFAARLPRVSRPRIGIAWAGSRKLADNAQRNVPLRAFAPVMQVAEPLVSLQLGEAAADAAAFGGAIVDVTPDCRDFLDTAALIANLDLVISVDTAVAHLAGALGKPVWLLHRRRGDWRWGLAGDCTGWYPAMRIFRQREAGSWNETMSEVAAALREVRA